MYVYVGVCVRERASWRERERKRKRKREKNIIGVLSKQATADPCKYLKVFKAEGGQGEARL